MSDRNRNIGDKKKCDKSTREKRRDVSASRKQDALNDELQVEMAIQTIECNAQIAAKDKHVKAYRKLRAFQGDKSGSALSDPEGWKEIMRNWQPHGIFERKLLEHSYLEASASFDVLGNPAKEAPTVKYFSTLFKAQLFHGGNFGLDSQSDPGKANEGPAKAVDLEVTYYNLHNTERALLLAEAKRHPGERAMAPAEVVKLESQIEGYGRSYLEKCEDVDFIYLASMVSTSLRLWIMRRPPATNVTKTGKIEKIRSQRKW